MATYYVIESRAKGSTDEDWVPTLANGESSPVFFSREECEAVIARLVSTDWRGELEYRSAAG